jgi:hypothetical protein
MDYKTERVWVLHQLRLVWASPADSIVFSSYLGVVSLQVRILLHNYHSSMTFTKTLSYYRQRPYISHHISITRRHRNLSGHFPSHVFGSGSCRALLQRPQRLVRWRWGGRDVDCWAGPFGAFLAGEKLTNVRTTPPLARRCLTLCAHAVVLLFGGGGETVTIHSVLPCLDVNTVIHTYLFRVICKKRASPANRHARLSAPLFVWLFNKVGRFTRELTPTSLRGHGRDTETRSRESDSGCNAPATPTEGEHVCPVWAIS